MSAHDLLKNIFSGIYKSIINFLTLMGIVTHSGLIAFTSTFYKSYFSGWGSSYTLQYQLLFIIAFEVKTQV
jgi:hypothetical protein